MKQEDTYNKELNEIKKVFSSQIKKLDVIAKEIAKLEKKYEASLNKE